MLCLRNSSEIHKAATFVIQGTWKWEMCRATNKDILIINSATHWSNRWDHKCPYSSYAHKNFLNWLKTTVSMGFSKYFSMIVQYRIGNRSIFPSSQIDKRHYYISLQHVTWITCLYGVKIFALLTVWSELQLNRLICKGVAGEGVFLLVGVRRDDFWTLPSLSIWVDFKMLSFLCQQYNTISQLHISWF